MAAFELFAGMHDVALKPQMLHSIINRQLSDDKLPLGSPLVMSSIASAVRTHRLLSESFPESTAPTLVKSWKTAVDEWADRLLSLVSSDMPDKRWAGVVLLGVTSQECNDDRFLSSYTDWLHKLLSHLQLPADSHVVKVASLASVSDLFTRLGNFPNLIKDGTSHASQLIHPCVKFLNEDHSEATWEGAACLLCTLVTFFPSSIRRYYDTVEGALVSKIMSAKCSALLLENSAHCLALLPKSRGDGSSWLLLMQKILLLLNDYFNDAFQGLEEGKKFDEILRLLVPPGNEPPPALGVYQMSEEAQDGGMSCCERLSIHSISSLMLCCCRMLTYVYPFQVTAPVRALLALVRRVLTVDGCVPQRLQPLMTAVQQEFICSKLPVYHSYSLEMFTATVKALHSQLLPYAADIVGLLTHYINICILPELRIKVYSIIRILLISMGAGIALYLAQLVTSNALIDLDSLGNDNNDTSSKACLKACTETLAQRNRKKRKRSTTKGPVEELGSDLSVSKRHSTTPISLKIAALEAVESLLTVGGTLKSEPWRSKIDLLLINVATNACKGGWAKDENNVFFPNEPKSTRASFQLTALRALLASLLSPARVRPPYLARGFELFRRGKHAAGTKVAELCAHALLALEILIHPRGLPLLDSSPVDNGGAQVFPRGAYLPRNGSVDSSSEDDDLYARWCNDDNIDLGPMKAVAGSEQHSRTLIDPSVDLNVGASKEPAKVMVGSEEASRTSKDPSVDIGAGVAEEPAKAVAGSEEPSEALDGPNDENIDADAAKEHGQVVAGLEERFGTFQDRGFAQEEMMLEAQKLSEASTVPALSGSRLGRGIGPQSSGLLDSGADETAAVANGPVSSAVGAWSDVSNDSIPEIEFIDSDSD